MADQVPVVWDHGEGVWVTDVDGYEYIDFTSGVLVTNLGHSHPHHVEAIQRQAGRLLNCYSFPTPERVALSQRLVALFPDNLDQVFMLTTGAETTEAAMRIAKRYTGKHEILAFYGAFHGRTFGPISVAGSMKTKRKFGPQLPGSILAPFPYFYRTFTKARPRRSAGIGASRTWTASSNPPPRGTWAPSSPSPTRGARGSSSPRTAGSKS